MQILYQTCYWLTTALCISLGLFVLWKNPRSGVNVTWALMSFAVGIWAFFVIQYFFETDDARSLLWARVSMYAAVWIPVFFAHFGLRLVERSLRKNLIVTAGYVFAMLMAFVSLSSWFVASVTPKVGLPHYAEPGPLYHLFTLQFFGLVVYTHWLIARHMAEQTPERQRQIRYVMLATVIGFLGGGTCFLPIYDIPFRPDPSLLLPIYPAIITYAIVRHQLMDIRIVIRRGLIYSILAALLTAVYLVLVLLSERMLQGMVGYRSVVASVVTAFAIAMGFIPARNLIQRWVDIAFFGGSQEMLAEQNERLRSELIQAERTKAVAALAAGLAHEIKNPLTAIKTFTEYLPSRHQDRDFVVKFERIVSQELQKIHTIVANLLTFAKPQPIRQEEVRLAELVEETAELLGWDCVKRHVTLTTDVDPAIWVTGDRTQLKQALLNLCLNSLDAMADGGRLQIAAAKNCRNASLWIQDSGCGIPRERLEKVFEPFFTTKSTGTGLGLSVVRGIIKQHYGLVHITSQPAQGTRVEIQLPITSGTG